MLNTSQQWDFPNAWPPLQHVLIEGLLNMGSEESLAIARDMAVRWLYTGLVAFRRTGTYTRRRYVVSLHGGAQGSCLRNTMPSSLALGAAEASTFPRCEFHGLRAACGKCCGLQLGFGWTNGVVFVLLQQFGSTLPNVG